MRGAFNHSHYWGVTHVNIISVLDLVRKELLDIGQPDKLKTDFYFHMCMKQATWRPTGSFQSSFAQLHFKMQTCFFSHNTTVYSLHVF